MEKKLKVLEVVDVPQNTAWDAFQEQIQVTAVHTGAEAYELLQENEYDMIFIDRVLHDMDGLELLYRVKRQELCPFLVLTSEAPDFCYAQQGIICGVFDYLLRPLSEESLRRLLTRVQESMYRLEENQQRDCILLVRAMRTEEVGQVFDRLVQRLRTEQTDALQADTALRLVYAMTVKKIFAEYPWLYRFRKQDTDAALRDTLYRRRLLELNEHILYLYPQTKNEKLDKALQYLLEHIDSGCLQKDVAAAMYISPPALSELFRSQLGMSFHAYTTEIKLLRAQYLSRYTTIKPYKICQMLGYKDADYFSRIYRKRFGVSLSYARRGDNLEEP